MRTCLRPLDLKKHLNETFYLSNIAPHATENPLRNIDLRNDLSVLHLLQTSIEPAEMQHIRHCEHAHTAWSALERTHLANLTGIQRAIERTLRLTKCQRLSTEKDLDQHLAAMQNLFGKLVAAGSTMTIDAYTTVLMDSFPGDMFTGLDQLLTNGFLNFSTLSEVHTRIKANFKIPPAATARPQMYYGNQHQSGRPTTTHSAGRRPSNSSRSLNSSRKLEPWWYCNGPSHSRRDCGHYKRDLANNCVHPDRSGPYSITSSNHAHANNQGNGQRFTGQIGNCQNGNGQRIPARNARPNFQSRPSSRSYYTNGAHPQQYNQPPPQQFLPPHSNPGSNYQSGSNYHHAYFTQLIMQAVEHSSLDRCFDALIDSGCTSCSSPSLELFENLEEIDPILIEGAFIECNQQGTLSFETNGRETRISNVLYSPEFPVTLLSLSRLAADGLEFTVSVEGIIASWKSGLM